MVKNDNSFRRWRMSKLLTVEDVARLLKVSKTAISRFECGSLTSKPIENAYTCLILTYDKFPPQKEVLTDGSAET